jgi:putative SOS response-associated peptidase YedK
MRIPSSRWPGKPFRDQAKRSNSNNRLLEEQQAVTEERSRILPVCRLHPETGQLVETSMRWGLIPNYVAERPDFRPLYAPAEIIFRRRMFYEAYHKRRCVVSMKEFHQRDKHRKRRTIVHKDGKSLSFAGIWENWRDPSTSKWERTFVIVTVRADGLIANIHARMPLILSEANLYRWLGPENDPRDLLNPPPDVKSVLTVLD